MAVVDLAGGAGVLPATPGEPAPSLGKPVSSPPPLSRATSAASRLWSTLQAASTLSITATGIASKLQDSAGLGSSIQGHSGDRMAYEDRLDPPHEQITLNLWGGWTAELDPSAGASTY